MLPRPLVCLLALVFVSGSAWAEPDNSTDLRTIMQGLRDDTVAIFDALMVEDFEKVVAAADRIANHPRIPPDQVKRVAAELGEEMSAFKHMDHQVHDLSLSISAAAQDNDRISAFADYKKMLDGCMACHASYRDRVATALSQPAGDK